jgi:hypothetical protein
VPVPGLVTREGDVDGYLLASEDNHQVAVDIGQPVLRDRAGRPPPYRWSTERRDMRYTR